jgi:predicted metal-dependent peptidase
MKNDDLIRQANERLALARAVVLQKAPYLMHLIYGFMPQPIFNHPIITTLAVTKNLVLFHNPVWVVLQKETRLAAGLVHEANHVLRATIDRGGFIPDRALFNKAADIPINADLKKAGWDMDPMWLYPETYGFPEGLTSEQYYELLEKKSGGGGRGKNAPGKSPKGQENEQPGVGQGSCGGCAGNPSPEENTLDEGGGRSEAEQQLFVEQTCEAIRATTDAKMRGSLPAWMKELAEAMRAPPKVPWQRKVAVIVRKTTGQVTSGGSDFSLSRPSKRSLVRGVLRPGMIECQPNICFILDTSGSMGLETQIRDALVEICGCMVGCGVDSAYVIQADAAVAETKKRRFNEILKMPITGRGGTHFTPAIDQATKLRPRPDIIIYMTDGDGYAPKLPPAGIAFIWCLVPSYCSRRPARWGEVVVIQDGEHPFETRPPYDMPDDPDEDDEDAVA